MNHKCKLPELDLENTVDHLRSFSWIYARADDIPAAHRLPPDQPIWCWCITGGGKIMDGDPEIHPDLLVLPVNACPFCTEVLKPKSASESTELISSMIMRLATEESDLASLEVALRTINDSWISAVVIHSRRKLQSESL